MTQAQTFHQFCTTFQQLADEAGITQKDRLNDIYNKLSTVLQQTLIVIKRIVINDFQLFCDLAGGADGDLRRLYKEQFERSKARANAVNAATAPMSTPTTKTSVPAVTLNRVLTIIFACTTSAIPSLFVKAAISNLIETKCFNCEKVGHFARDCTLPRRLEMKEIEDDIYALSEEEKKRTGKKPDLKKNSSLSKYEIDLTEIDLRKLINGKALSYFVY